MYFIFNQNISFYFACLESLARYLIDYFRIFIILGQCTILTTLIHLPTNNIDFFARKQIQHRNKYNYLMFKIFN